MVVAVVYFSSLLFLFYSAFHLIAAFSWHCLHLSIPTSLGFLSCVYFSFLLSSIYGFQFQVSRVHPLFLLLPYFFSWVYDTCCVLMWQAGYTELLIDADISLDDMLLWFCGGIPR